ncbi:MAG TPA: hypothetical protein VIV56_07320 [Gemmatimonadales bacterium]
MATYYRQADIAAMLAEFGVPITLGLTTVFGIVDRTEEEVLRGVGAHSLGERIEVTVETDSLPGLVLNVEVSVDGEMFGVRDVRRIDDGALTQFQCERLP